MSAPAEITWGDLLVDYGVEDGIEWCTTMVDVHLWVIVNGYARLPEGHPWTGLDFSQIEELLGVYGDDEEVTCELTFSEDGWIGFDTGHWGDYWPGKPTSLCAPWAIQWTSEMVADMARALARMVARYGA